MDALEIQPRITAVFEHRTAASSCCGAKLGITTADEGTSCWLCLACSQPCDRVLSDPVEVTAHG